jgi:serine beta-lactamase-like protein LACTB
MNRYKQLLSILLILFLTPFDAVLAKDNSVAEQAHTLMQEFFDASDTPGLAVSVGLGGTIIWSEGFGYADLEQLVKVDPARTKLRIGGVIKPMTAHAVAQLVQAGKLDLEAPVQTYVPGFPQKRGPITTRQLLAHLSGIRYYRGEEFLNRNHYESVAAGSVMAGVPWAAQPSSGSILTVVW